MARESLESKRKRSEKIVALLKRYYPDAKCSLNYENPLQLLVATILSAQCTDKRVNMVTPALFARFPNVGALAGARLEDLEEMVKSTNFYRNKAKAIKASAQLLIEKHAGEVPDTMEDLNSLPGVGRKTANVILGNVFGLPSMVVDTHVGRISNRLGLAQGADPVKLESQLEEVVKKRDWVHFSHLLIEHGREICKARTPECPRCFLNEICPKKIS